MKNSRGGMAGISCCRHSRGHYSKFPHKIFVIISRDIIGLENLSTICTGIKPFVATAQEASGTSDDWAYL